MKNFKMPSAVTIVLIFLAVVAVLTWFVPTSVVEVTESGENIIHFNAAFDADGNIIENAGTNPVGLWDFFLAPIEGFISAADIAVTILITGGFLAVMTHVGALNAGIGKLVTRFSGSTLIVMLMFVFALMGTVYGAWEELPAYAVIIIPLFVTAGYDVITGMMVVLIGAVVGNMASVVNPYSIGAAVAAIGNEDLSLGSGIVLRLILFVVMFVMAAFSVLRYANKVKKDPSKSCVAHLDDINTRIEGVDFTSVELTTRHKWSLVVFALMIIIIICGYVPWGSIPVGDGTMYDYVNIIQNKIAGSWFGNLVGADNFMPFGDWYFNEFSVVWFIGAIIVMLINKIPEKEFISVFTDGARDLVGVVFVLAASRGISIFMGSRDSGMSITFIYWIQNILSGVPLWAFVVAAIFVYLLIGIFLQSTSGVAGITMPIFGALAFALFASSSAGAVGGQILLLSTFTCGINFICGIYPESSNMGTCEMANVPYNIFLKQWLKTLIPILIVAGIIISVAPYIGIV
ncbi:putative ion transporter superfamily protein YfcC [Clostridiales Family XIII bacterium PM5-7]